MKSTTIKCAAIATLSIIIPNLLAAAPLSPQLLFDVDFNDPNHFYTNQSHQSLPHNGATAYRYLKPTINSFNDFDSAMVFTSSIPQYQTPVANNYSQLMFHTYLPSPYNIYRRFKLEVDVNLGDWSNNNTKNDHFTILCDAPRVHTLIFRDDMQLQVYNPDEDESFTFVGQYQSNKIYHVQMDWDYLNHTFKLAIDQQTIHSGKLLDEFHPTVARFHLNKGTIIDPDVTADTPVQAAIDNLKITAYVPEPSSFLLSATTLLALTSGRKRSH